jgi:hypothetical protein
MQNGFSVFRHPAFRVGVWLLFGIFLYFYLGLFKNALIDDAFITLRYVKTLLTSGTWGFFPGVIANSATSPLNVILLTLISLVTGPTEAASLWLYLLCLLCIAVVLVRLARQVTGSEVYGWLAVVALVFNPLLISTAGLEGIIWAAFFVLAIYFYQIQRWAGLAAALGMLTLTRPEGILFFLVFILFTPDKQTKIKLAAVYLLCITPWYLFSWIHLGSFLPDTFFIKTEQATWYQWDFFNGMTSLYYVVYPLETALSFVFLPLAILLFHRKLRQVTVLVIVGLAGLIHFAGYSFLRVPPFHWYYVPQVVTLILLGSLGVGVAYRNSSSLWQRRAWGLVTALYFLMPALGMISILGHDHFIVREMPIHSNWGTLEQYKEVGMWLRDNHPKDTILLVGGEIGTLAYYCDCHLLDRFSDRRWLRDYISEHNSQAGIRSVFIRLNFAFYSYPNFPAENYTLRAYSAQPNINIERIKEWKTSTKWVPDGLLVLSRQ